MPEPAPSPEPPRAVSRQTYFSTIAVVAVAGFVAGLGSYSIFFVR